MSLRDEKRQITVEIDVEQLRALHQLGLVERCSFNDVVRDAITEHLARNEEKAWSRVRFPKPMSEQERRDQDARFRAAIEAMRAGAEDDNNPLDIEDEITAAVEEVRQERLMRQKAAGA